MRKNSVPKIEFSVKYKETGLHVSPDDMERTECSEYVIDNYHAAQNRKKLRIVR